MNVDVASRPLKRLWTAVLLGYLAFGATLQTLPTYVIQRFHASPVVAGWCVGIAFGATALTRPFAGRAGDAGSGRLVVLGGAALITSGGLGQLFAPNITSILVSRVVMGIGEAALFSGALPWVLHAAPPSRRSQVAGYFGLSMWSGLALGPVLATGTFSVVGQRGVWILICALGAASFAVAITTPRASVKNGGVPVASLSRPKILPLSALLPGSTFGLTSFGYGTVATSLVLFMREPQIGHSWLGLSVFSFAFLAGRTIGSPVVDRYNGYRVGVAGIVLEASGLAVISRADDLEATLIGAAITGVALSVMFPVVVDIILRRIGTSGSGAAVGVTTSLWDIGIMAAGPISGLLTNYGYHTVFGVAALAVIAALFAQLPMLCRG